MQDQAPPHLAITHYTELLDEKGLVLAKADAISPHLVSVAEVCSFAQRTLDTSLQFTYCNVGASCTFNFADAASLLCQCLTCWQAFPTNLVCFTQARTLMTLTYAFYTDPVSFLHVHKFNHSPAEFNFAEMARELGLESEQAV